MPKINVFLLGFFIGFIPTAGWFTLPLAMGFLLLVWICKWAYPEEEPQLTCKPTPEPYRHPATGRFCHICGADGFAHEPCDSGLHS